MSRQWERIRQKAASSEDGQNVEAYYCPAAKYYFDIFCEL